MTLILLMLITTDTNNRRPLADERRITMKKRYIPKKGDKFRAFLKIVVPGKEHIGSPFSMDGKACNATKTIVTALDKNGSLCILGFAEFRFERMKDGE